MHTYHPNRHHVKKLIYERLQELQLEPAAEPLMVTMDGEQGPIVLNVKARSRDSRKYLPKARLTACFR